MEMVKEDEMLEKKLSLSGSIANFKCCCCDKEAILLINDTERSAVECAYCDEHQPRAK